MKKIVIPLVIIFGILICTVRIHAQSAQVSPVSNLQGNNASVVNDNFQYVQNGINGLLSLLGQYFTGGILNTANGGTGINSSNYPTGTLLVTSNTGIWSGLQAGTTGDALISQGPGVVPSYTALSFPIPKNLISIWTDTTGATQVNSGTTTHFFVIDSNTDWAGKDITIIANIEYRSNTSFAGLLPSVINTSNTALSNMSFSGSATSINRLNFIMQSLTLPTNNYTVLNTSTTTGANPESYSIGIGTNNLGNLCLVAVNSHQNSGSTDTVFTQLAGTILRTP